MPPETRWPSIARSAASKHDSNATIIFPYPFSLPQKARCSAHADYADYRQFDLKTGQPSGSDSNGHPAESGATHYERCPTCNRLVLVVPGTTYARVSHRLDLSGSDFLADAYLEEASPAANHESDASVVWSGAALDSKHPLVMFKPIGQRLPPGANVIKAELRVYLTAVTPPTTAPCYELLQAAAMNEATWNEYASGNAWDVSGARSSGVDYDPTMLSQTSPIATGWCEWLSGDDFRYKVSARRNEYWIAGVINPAAGGGTFDSTEGTNPPELRVWYEAPRSGR